MTAKLLLGTQGWNYDGWVGPFYPPKTSKQEMLSLYSRVFNTVEIDSTFYAIPAEGSVRSWAARTPAEFTFSVKLPSEITHKNRLKDSREYFVQFIERMRSLKHKLGCVLIQLPPDFSPGERQSLMAFLKLLPTDIRFAIEFRDQKWITEQTLKELNEHRVALTLTDSKWIDRDSILSISEHATIDFVYIRWLGPRELTDFSHIQIDRSKEISQWEEFFVNIMGRVSVIFGYFNNHFQGHSPASCNNFKRVLGMPVVSPSELIIQPSLF
jgi:uncharacterized protein YecE (DUF72 family)